MYTNIYLWIDQHTLSWTGIRASLLKSTGATDSNMHNKEKKELGWHEGNLPWTSSAGVDNHRCASQLLRPSISHFEQFSVCFLCSANTCGAHQAKVNSSGWKVRWLRVHRPKTNLQKKQSAYRLHRPSHPRVSGHMHYTEFRITDPSLKALIGSGGTRSFERYALLYWSNQTRLGSCFQLARWQVQEVPREEYTSHTWKGALICSTTGRQGLT